MSMTLSRKTNMAYTKCDRLRFRRLGKMTINANDKHTLSWGSYINLNKTRQNVS